MRRITRLAVFALSTLAGLVADQAPATAASPSVQEQKWAEIRALMAKQPVTDGQSDRRGHAIERDAITRELRTKGLAFWDAYPEDARRYWWFMIVENRGWSANHLANGLEIPEDEVKLWRARRPAIRAESMLKASPDMRVYIRYEELRRDILVIQGECRWGADLDPVRSAKLTPEFVIDEILEFADTHPPLEDCKDPRVKTGRVPVDAMNLLLSLCVRGDTPESRALRAATVQRMRASSFEPMRRFASDLASSLDEQPLTLTGRTLDGQNFDLAAYRGKVVLIDGWATWCAPCVEEMPLLRKFQERFPAKDFALVGLSIDAATNREKVMGILRKAGAEWPQIAESEEIFRRLGGRSVPYTVIVGRDGRVVTAGSFSMHELEAMIAKQLN